MKKRFIGMIQLCIFSVMLSGCAVLREKTEQILWEHSGVEDEIAYVQYQQMESADALDENGLYHSSVISAYEQAAAQALAGTVHVSFAKNEFIEIQYYKDEALSEPLISENCRLNPGDTIYASDPIIVNQKNEFYQFSEVRVMEISADGREMKPLTSVSHLPGALFHIPEDYNGTELSIVPLGTYRDRTVFLNAVFTRPGEADVPLENGVWLVNGIRHGNGILKLNPMESYRIVYDYSVYGEDWYFAGSEPEFYWENSGESSITFLVEASAPDNMEYKVKLHPYGSLEIKNGVNYQNAVDSFLDSAAVIFGNKSIIDTQNIISLLQVNGITAANNFSDTGLYLSKLKSGDEVYIRIPGELKIVVDGLGIPNSVEKDGEREYRIIIPDAENMDFRMTVSRRNSDSDGIFEETEIENGTLSVYNSEGIRYRSGSELPADDEKVRVVIVPDETFCVYGRNVKENIYQSEMKYADYVKNLDTIIVEHPIRPGIFVTLDTDDELGNCVFWTGTEMLHGTVMLREGQDLQFDFLLNTDSGYEVFMTAEEKAMAADVWSPYAASRKIEVNEDLQGEILRCRDFITLREEVKADDFEDPY